MLFKEIRTLSYFKIGPNLCSYNNISFIYHYTILPLILILDIKLGKKDWELFNVWEMGHKIP